MHIFNIFLMDNEVDGTPCFVVKSIRISWSVKYTKYLKNNIAPHRTRFETNFIPFHKYYYTFNQKFFENEAIYRLRYICFDAKPRSSD